MDHIISEIDRDLAETTRLLDGINGELRRMRDHRRNTRWHTDRLAARRNLLAQRDRLLEEQRQIAMSN